MRTATLISSVLAVALMAAGCAAPAPGKAELERQVADTERAFAATMKRRDHAAFSAFLSDEAVFFSGPAPLRGKSQVAQGWLRFYDKPEAPFSWEPEQVEVLASGTLAFSSGPVYNPQGKLVARYNSVWRLEAPGTWRVLFDKGEDVCDCAASPRAPAQAGAN